MAREKNLGRVRGYSAYEIAQQEGFDGSKTEWLESLRLGARIGRVTFLPEGSDPTVSVKVEGNEMVFDFGFPKFVIHESGGGESDTPTPDDGKKYVVSSAGVENGQLYIEYEGEEPEFGIDSDGNLYIDYTGTEPLFGIDSDGNLYEGE